MRTRAAQLALVAGLAASLVGCLPQDEHRIGDNGGGVVGVGGTGGAGVPAAPAALAISPEEAATRLSEVLWSRSPEAAWLAMVTPGLHNVDDVRALATDMLADSKARVAVGAFYRWWLNLDRIRTVEKDGTLFPEWNGALAESMADETEMFGVEQTLALNGTLGTLLTGKFSYLNDRLASIYGVDGVSGSDLRRVNLTSDLRGGLLTQPGLQAMASLRNRNSPVLRGKFIRERFFCQRVPPPPADVPGLGGTFPAGGKTLREAYAEHRANPVCASCHVMMDPLGFAYEGFDPVGRERRIDAGKPVDLTGELNGGSGQPRQFDGPLQLADLMAASGEVSACLVRQWLSFVLGRELIDNARDNRSLATISAIAAPTGFELRYIIAAAVASESFLAP